MIKAFVAKIQRHPLRLHFLAIVFYALLTFSILYPIVFHNGNLAAGYDYYNAHWSMWWMRHALTTPGLSIFETNFLMAPSVNNLSYHALAAVWYPLWAVLEPWVGTLTAINVIMIVCCILNGYLCFLLLLSEGIMPELALLGGAALQISPVLRYFFYNTHINLMDWFWIPVHLLLWKQIVSAINAQRAGRILRWVLIQGVLLWALVMTDLEFPIFLAFLLVPYALLSLWRTRRRGQLILAGLLALTVALVLLWFAGPLPYMLRFSGGLAPGRVEDRPGIPFPRGYLSLDQVWWQWNTPTLGGFVTFAVLLSIVVGWVSYRVPKLRDRWFWFWLILPPFILTLGPTLTIGSNQIEMPFRWLFTLTNGNFRMPWRLAPVFIIAAMLFVGKTWTPLLASASLKKIRPFVIAGVFSLLIMDVRVFQPGPLKPVLPPYRFYEMMGRERGKPYDDYVVLEVPTAAGTGEQLVGDADAITFEYYGLTHGKRMLNGFISRTPITNFWGIYTDDPLLSWLGQRRLLDSKLVEPELRRIITQWPIGYIVIHQDYIGLEGPTNQEIIGYFNTLPDLLCPVVVEGTAVVYRTNWHPDGCPPRTPLEVTPGVYQIKMGMPGDERFIGWGWYWPETVPGMKVRWTGARPTANLYVDLPPGDYQFAMNVQAFYHPRKLTIEINGTSLGTADVSVEGLQTLNFKIPAKLIGAGRQLTLTLRYDSVDTQAQFGLGPDQRPLAVMVDWIRFTREVPANKVF